MVQRHTVPEAIATPGRLPGTAGENGAETKAIAGLDKPGSE
jgi:hypothetical protein